MEIHHKKIAKFISLIESLVLQLDDQQQLAVHNSIDQFYYMTKAEELKLLLVQYREEAEKLQTIRNRIDSRYREAFHHWRRDKRWLHNNVYKKEVIK